MISQMCEKSSKVNEYQFCFSAANDKYVASWGRILTNNRKAVVIQHNGSRGMASKMEVN